MLSVKFDATIDGIPEVFVAFTQNGKCVDSM